MEQMDSEGSGIRKQLKEYKQSFLSFSIKKKCFKCSASTMWIWDMEPWYLYSLWQLM